MSKRKTPTLSNQDDKFSRLIRSRDGACRKCGTTEHLQCAHIVSRTYLRTRHDPENAIALCRSCHVRFTFLPVEWRRWVEDNYPGLMSELESRAVPR